MEKHLESILEAALQAPSGENCQPWRFSIEKETICVWNIPSRDASPYNSGQRGSYVAHGALLENLSIAAKHFGYGAYISLFPDKSLEHLVATISLVKETPQDDTLYPFIFSRTTNRKPYRKEFLDQ